MHRIGADFFLHFVFHHLPVEDSRDPLFLNLLHTVMFLMDRLESSQCNEWLVIIWDYCAWSRDLAASGRFHLRSCCVSSFSESSSSLEIVWSFIKVETIFLRCSVFENAVKFLHGVHLFSWVYWLFLKTNYAFSPHATFIQCRFVLVAELGLQLFWLVTSRRLVLAHLASIVTNL